jgi:GNAT superfamily N-acetyltransferase
MFTSFAVPPNNGHIFDCYTVEKYRGQKLYQAIVYQLVEWAKAHHATHMYIDTVEGNTGAYKGIINLGFKYISLHTNILFFNKTLLEYDTKR